VDSKLRQDKKDARRFRSSKFFSPLNSLANRAGLSPVTEINELDVNAVTTLKA
jgi:hypothetical protein